MDRRPDRADRDVARPTGGAPERLVGIDALRAVAALTVMCAHLGVVPPEVFGTDRAGAWAVARLVSNCLFNGPAAVIVFFVISGFCIHFPQARSGARAFDLPRFYVRRAVRIGLPVIPAMGIHAAFGLQVEDMHTSVLWSVVCEAIYYLIYPALLIAGRTIGWGALVLVSYGVATALCLTNLDALNDGSYAYYALGGHLTWIVGLPCWLLGCWLAEHRQAFAVPTVNRIWAARAAILVLSVVLGIARYHLPPGLHIPPVYASTCFTLNAFALPVTAWVGLELALRRKSTPSRLLEWTGRWSYSLYLVHPVTTAFLASVGIAAAAFESYYLLRLIVALSASYLFFLLFERPSHRLGIWLTRRPGPSLLATAEPARP